MHPGHPWGQMRARLFHRLPDGGGILRPGWPKHTRGPSSSSGISIRTGSGSPNSPASTAPGPPEAHRGAPRPVGAHPTNKIGCTPSGKSTVRGRSPAPRSAECAQTNFASRPPSPPPGAAFRDRQPGTRRPTDGRPRHRRCSGGALVGGAREALPLRDGPGVTHEAPLRNARPSGRWVARSCTHEVMGSSGFLVRFSRGGGPGRRRGICQRVGLARMPGGGAGVPAPPPPTPPGPAV